MIAKIGEWREGNETPISKLLKEAPLVAVLIDGKQVVVGNINEHGGDCDHCQSDEIVGNVGVQRYAKIVWVEE